jgi:hypothetical protein
MSGKNDNENSDILFFLTEKTHLFVLLLGCILLIVSGISQLSLGNVFSAQTSQNQTIDYILAGVGIVLIMVGLIIWLAKKPVEAAKTNPASLPLPAGPASERTRPDVPTITTMDILGSENPTTRQKLDVGKLEQGGRIEWHGDTFRYALNAIHRKMILCQNNLDHTPVEVKMITVAMSHSWKPFFDDEAPGPDIKGLMSDKKMPDAKLNFEIMILDPVYLENLYIYKYHEWFTKSADRDDGFSDFSREVGDFNGRLSITYKRYKNLPHWHGVLIDEDYLFLGRTDLEPFQDPLTKEDKPPSLKVGSKLYRFYNRSDIEGIERIDLFKHWHQYYFNWTPGPKIALRKNTLVTIPTTLPAKKLMQGKA